MMETGTALSEVRLALSQTNCEDCMANRNALKIEIPCRMEARRSDNKSTVEQEADGHAKMEAPP